MDNMDPQETSPILKLPKEVFIHHLFQFFRTNDLLRFRRTCKKAKELTDEHLRKYTPSKSTIYWIDKNELMSRFMEQDRKSKFKIPSANLEVILTKRPNGWNEFFESPLLEEALKRYKDQITNLRITRMTFPMKRDSIEWKFYDKLPNLKELHVSTLCLENASSSDGNVFPKCFSRLKVFNIKIVEFQTNAMGEFDQLWTLMVKNFSSLDTFCHPFYCWCKDSIPSCFEGRERGYPTLFQNMTKILELLGSSISSKSRLTLDFEKAWATQNDSVANDSFLPYFVELCLKHKNKMKLVNIHPNILLKLGKPELEKIIAFIRSLKYYLAEEIYGLIFPNVVRLHIDDYDWDKENRINLIPLATLSKNVSNGKFPNLRVLHLANRSWSNQQLASLWGNLTSLEELFLDGVGHGHKLLDGGAYKEQRTTLEDEAFFGRSLESATPGPAFLQLTNLKKFELRFHPRNVRLTDAVFHEVFRLMRLTEFILRSEDFGVPIRMISTDAILALRSGPFGETIQNFPFHGWSLDVNPVEFFRLTQMFPCNRLWSEDFGVPIRMISMDAILALRSGPFGETIQNFPFYNRWSLDVYHVEFFELSKKFPGNQCV